MTARIKFAIERGPGQPPGSVHIKCPCGYQPEIMLNDLTVRFVRCFRCGAEYDRVGFVIHPSHWDHPEWGTSTMQARVWLLAHFGPVALKPDEWKYNPTRDEWAYAGRDFTLNNARVKVTSEISTSLAKRARAGRVPRHDALRMIGYEGE